jgi:hypothetical protein
VKPASGDVRVLLIIWSFLTFQCSIHNESIVRENDDAAAADDDNENITNVVTETEGSAPLIPKPDTGHDPEPVPSTSHPHNTSP